MERNILCILYATMKECSKLLESAAEILSAEIEKLNEATSGAEYAVSEAVELKREA